MMRYATIFMRDTLRLGRVASLLYDLIQLLFVLCHC